MSKLTFLKPKKLLIVALLVLFTASAAWGVWKYTHPISRAVCERCNILLIDLDTHRSDELPCYGYHRNTTPNLCKLASNATLFKNNFAPAPWTLPSMFSTITSLYPAFHKVRFEYQDILAPNIPTLAEQLAKAGYTTIYSTVFPGLLYGKDQISSGNGGFRGYDKAFSFTPYEIISGMQDSSKPWFIHYYTFAHLPYILGFHVDGTKPIVALPRPEGFPVYEPEYNSMVGKYIKKHYKEIFETHIIEKYKSVIFSDTSESDVEVMELFQTLCKPNPVGNCKESWKVEHDAYMQFVNTVNPSHVEYVRMMYDSVLREIDAELAETYQLAEQSPYNRNTIVIVMSDHGEAFGEHGTFSHDPNDHTELYSTPLIIRAPNLPQGQIDYPSSNLDIFPTILDLVGIPKPAGLQGMSVLDYPKGPHTGTERFVISQNYDTGVLLQNKEWLYFLSEEKSEMQDSVLYHKLTDPSETTNVAEQYPALVSKLYAQAKILRSYDVLFDTVQNRPKQPDLKIDPQKLERLRKEGYF